MHQIQTRCIPDIIFIDEKEFTIDPAPNIHKDNFNSREDPKGVPDSVKLTFMSKHADAVMMFGLVSSDGKKMPSVFFKKSEKINKKSVSGGSEKLCLALDRLQ